MSTPRKSFNYKVMYELLKAITEKVKLASEQEERGEKVTACGMSNEDIANLCEDYLPNLFNPYMTIGDIKEKSGLSESTINRAIKDGKLKGKKARFCHFHLFKVWDVREFLKKRKENI